MIIIKKSRDKCKKKAKKKRWRTCEKIAASKHEDAAARAEKLAYRKGLCYIIS